MAGRGSVGDHQIVRSVGSGQPDEMLDLAEHEQVVDTRSRTGHDVHHTGVHQSLGQTSQSLGGEIVLQRFTGRQSAQMDGAPLAGSAAAGHDVTVVRTASRRTRTEQCSQAGSTVKCHNQHAKSGIGCSGGQNSRYRCLADTPLAGHHEQTRTGEQSARIRIFRRHSCAD